MQRSLGSQSSPDVQQNDDDEIDDRAHNDEERADLETGSGIIVKSDRESASGTALTSGGGG